MTLFGMTIVAFVALLLLVALFSKPDKVIRRTLLAVTVAMVFIPTFGPPPEYVIAFNGVYAVALALALARSPRADVAQRRFMLLPSLFVVFMAINESIGAGTGHTLGQWVLAVLLLLFGAVAIRDHAGGRLTIFKVLAWSLPIQLVMASAEQVLAGVNPWPKGDENFDDIANRVNELFPVLEGRSVGTFGHPILLGTYAVLAFVACVFLYRHSRKRVYLLLACLTPLLLALSGTRNAAIAMAVVAALMFAFAPGRLRALRVVISLAAIGATSVINVLDLLGLSGIGTTTSYQHRSRIIGSIPRLLDRDPFDSVFGSGGSSGGTLFGSGIVQGVPGYYFFDNQYVRVLAFAGVVGVLFLALALVVGLIKNDNAGRLVLIAMMVMSASYDVLTWNFSYLFLFLGMAVPLGGLAAKPGSSTAPRPDARQRAENPPS